jgi:hypothetical protein
MSACISDGGKSVATRSAARFTGSGEKWKFSSLGGSPGRRCCRGLWCLRAPDLGLLVGAGEAKGKCLSSVLGRQWWKEKRVTSIERKTMGRLARARAGAGIKEVSGVG